MLLFLAGATYGLYQIMLSSLVYGSLLSPVMGQTLFIGLALLELLIICFVTPAVTAGAVSAEREKLTYEMLLTTPLSPGSILWGKLIAALSYVLLLIFAAVPLASLVFIFGGVAPRQMLNALVVLIMITVMLGVVSVFFSVWLGRTGRATIMSYLFVLLIVVAPLVAYIATGIVRQATPPRWLLIPNPVSVLFSAILPATSSQGMGMGGLLQGLGMALSGNLEQINGMVPGPLRPLYHYSLPLYAVLTVVLYLLAGQLIKPVRRWRPGWAGVGVALALVLALSGGTALAFFSTAAQYELASVPPTPTPGFFAPPMPVVAERAVRVEPVASIPTPTPAASATTLTVEEEAAIYAAVVEGLLTEDNDPGTLFLARQTDSVVGYTDAPPAPAGELSVPLQDALTAALVNSSHEVRWIDDWPSNEEGTAITEGVVIVFGQIHRLENGSALVSATATFAAGHSTGASYLLANTDDQGWTLSGEMKTEWGD
jgi:ABC-type transport system involved in multi-copper enzyme maturation permease subunit